MILINTTSCRLVKLISVSLKTTHRKLPGVFESRSLNSKSTRDFWNIKIADKLLKHSKSQIVCYKETYLFMNVINQFQLLLLVNNTLIRKHTYSSDFNHLKKFETEHKQD